MIIQEHVSFKTAKFAKVVLGFDKPTLYYYDFIGDIGATGNLINWNQSKETLYSRPTVSEFKWWFLRKYGIGFLQIVLMWIIAFATAWILCLI